MVANGRLRRTAEPFAPFVESRSPGKERDSETGLDYFGARYYASSMGRWMVPDWAAKATAVPYADFGDPQTLNLYGYVRNNPLSKADIDGHCYPWCTVIGGAIIGGVIGGGGEIIAAKLHGKSIDWKKVEGSAVKGAVTGAAIGLAGPEAGVATTAALGAGGNVVGGIAGRTAEGQSAKEVLSPTAVAKDAASGAVGGAIGGAKVGEAAGEFVAQGSEKERSWGTNMRRNEKCKYSEGDWFAVPLRTNGYAVGIIARAARQGRILLGYFFGPRRHDLPNLDDVRNYRSTGVILVAHFGDLGLLNCAWPVLGHYQWNRSSWPMPVFARKDVISGEVSLVEYHEDDPSRELRLKKPGHGDASQYPEDGLFGYGAVELRLTKLLEDSAPNR